MWVSKEILGFVLGGAKRWSSQPEWWEDQAKELLGFEFKNNVSHLRQIQIQILENSYTTTMYRFGFGISSFDLEFQVVSNKYL